MQKLLQSLSENKSRFQKITFLVLMLVPIMMFIGAKISSSLLIVTGLVFAIGANLLAIFNK